MTNEAEEALEKLTEFLYIVPVGLLEFDANGQIYLANPRITQIFNPFTMTGMVSNIFEILKPQLPDFVDQILAFESDSGMIAENERLVLMAPTGPKEDDPKEELVLDITVIKQQSGRFYASVNNVTEQTKVMRENMINNQRLDAIVNRVDDYGIFTLDKEGKVNSWNKAAAQVLKVSDKDALGQMYSKLMGIGEDKGESLLAATQQCGWVAFQNPGEDIGDTLLTVIKEPEGGVLGYSVITRDH